MLVFNDTINGLLSENIPIDYHISFLKLIRILSKTKTKEKLITNACDYSQYTSRKFANLLV